MACAGLDLRPARPGSGAVRGVALLLVGGRGGGLRGRRGLLERRGCATALLGHGRVASANFGRRADGCACSVGASAKYGGQAPALPSLRPLDPYPRGIDRPALSGVCAFVRACGRAGGREGGRACLRACMFVGVTQLRTMLEGAAAEKEAAIDGRAEHNGHALTRSIEARRRRRLTACQMNLYTPDQRKEQAQLCAGGAGHAGRSLNRPHVVAWAELCLRAGMCCVQCVARPPPSDKNRLSLAN